MSFFSMPASSRASLKASTIRDSGLLSQSSPNLVHPMPTMATLSLIPSAMLPPFSSVRICHGNAHTPGRDEFLHSLLTSDRCRFPEVSMYAASLVVVLAAEAQLYGHAHLQRLQLAVVQIEEPPAAAFEVDEAVDGRRTQAEGQQVTRVGEQRSPPVGEAVGVHLLDGAAGRLDAHF